MKTILVTNDDGIHAPGIYELVRKLKEIAYVIVVAPDRQKSAVSNAVTVGVPLRVEEVSINKEFFGYSVNGTPADCSKIALSTLLDEKPDLVVSGINHGRNTAVNVLYSGTVGGAMEGMLIGIPSIAFSIDSHDPQNDCTTAADIAQNICSNILKSGMPIGTYLNVNIPKFGKNKIKGTKITKHSSNIWNDRYEKRSDPFGREYYWFAGEYGIDEHEENSDDVALNEGFVSITPIKCSYTDIEYYESLQKIDFE
jgi:5'/3'-nucleotidase